MKAETFSCTEYKYKVNCKHFISHLLLSTEKELCLVLDWKSRLTSDGGKRQKHLSVSTVRTTQAAEQQGRRFDPFRAR